MTKIVNSKYKASRRLGVSIWGDAKDPFHSKNYRPGQHGKSTMGKTSDYGLHLRAKQRLRMHYGRVSEKQFRNIFKLASRMKGNIAENFVGLLERRLDAVIYRMNIAPTIFAARQMVSHGHIKVNGRRVNIPSARVSIGDTIEVKQDLKANPLVQNALSRNEKRVPDYIEFNNNDVSGKVLRIPSISDVPYPFDPELNLIVEFYSH